MGNMDELNVWEYAQEKELEDEYSDLCKSKEEIDAVLWCLSFIDDQADKYIHAVSERPHDPKERQEALYQLLADKPSIEQDEIRSEMKQLYPWYSAVQETKDEIFYFCSTAMKDAGMGKKKWLLLKPNLTKYLKDHIGTFYPQ